MASEAVNALIRSCGGGSLRGDPVGPGGRGPRVPHPEAAAGVAGVTGQRAPHPCSCPKALALQRVNDSSPAGRPCRQPGLTSHTAGCNRTSRPLPGAAGALSPGLSLAQWQPQSSAWAWHPARPLPGALWGPGAGAALLPPGSSSSPGSDPWDPVAGGCKGLAWSKRVLP